MAVREAEGDSTAYFRAKPEPQAGTPPNIQTAFSDMSDAQLVFYVRASGEWDNGKVPDRFNPWNSWGGEHTARATAKTNADNAQRELDRRAAEKYPPPPPLHCPGAKGAENVNPSRNPAPSGLGGFDSRGPS